MNNWIQNIIYKIKSWWYSHSYVWFGKVHKPVIPPSFDAFVIVRASEVFRSGPVDDIVTGDSIIHLGESMFETGVPGSKVTAIGGDTTDTLLRRLQSNVSIFKPKKVLIHVGGNDFLQKASVGHVLENLKVIIGMLLSSGVKHVGWMEVLPLGNPINRPMSVQDHLNPINSTKCPELYSRMSSLAQSGLMPGLSVLGNRAALSDATGYIRKDYGAADLIHVTKKAYTDVFVPSAQHWFETTGD